MVGFIRSQAERKRTHLRTWFQLIGLEWHSPKQFVPKYNGRDVKEWRILVSMGTILGAMKLSYGKNLQRPNDR